MLKYLMMGTVVALSAIGQLAHAKATAMDNSDLAVTVLAVPEAQLQPVVPDHSGTGQIAGVAAEALNVRTTPVILATPADISSLASGSGSQRQLTIQIPVTQSLNDQLANMSLHNVIIPQTNLR